MDFESQVSKAFAGPKPDVGQSTSSQVPPAPPQDFEPFEHDFHGREERDLPNLPLQRAKGGAPPHKSKKRKALGPLDGAPEKRRVRDGSSLEERKELHNQIERYVTSFPELGGTFRVTDPEVTPLEDMKFTLAQIQQRLNAKQELKLLQSGLVTACVGVEMASGFIPRNPVKLRGFGSNVSANMDLFNDTLKQIACKYGGMLPVSMEAQLFMILVRCAANTHTANMAIEAKEKAKNDTPPHRPPTPPPPPPPPPPEPTEPPPPPPPEGPLRRDEEGVEIVI